MLRFAWLQRLSRLLARRQQRRSAAIPLALEPLEDRTLPSAWPLVQSINRTTPADSVTNATSVTYTVTFSEPVTGVDPTDFGLTLTGIGAANLTQVTPVNASVYTVVVSSIIGGGTLGLNLIDNGSIHDLAGNPLTQQNAPAAFGAQQTFATGLRAVSVAVGDVNGDGKPDLALANYLNGSASILLGNGNGTFQAAQTFATGTFPQSVVLSDVNGDGKLDLAVGNVATNTVTVLLGNGNCTFQAGQSFATGAGPLSLAVGDVNGDGKPDLVVTNTYSIPAVNSSVSVLLGNGNGTFQPQQTFSTGPRPHSVVLGDVNHDGNLDLVVANYYSTSVSVLLGNGNGTFQNQQMFGAGQNPISVVVGDVNGDGKLDLAVADYGSNAVAILLGNGDGTFAARQTFAAGLGPQSLVLGDVSGDGIPDLAMVNFSPFLGGPRLGNGIGNVSVLRGTGNGTFQTDQTFATGFNPAGVALADVSGDGNPDLVVTIPVYARVSVLLGNGNGTFLPQQTFATGFVPQSMALGDVNGDGKLDAVMANRFSDTVSVLLGNGNGTFQLPQTFAADIVPYAVAIGDANGDGNIDLAVANNYGAEVSVLLGNGNGAFQAPQTFATGSYSRSLVLSDVNGDGKPDLVVANDATGSNSVSVLLSNGNGTFQPQQTFATGSGAGALVSGDVNGDGKPDLAVTISGYAVSVLLGNGNGTFQAPQTFATGFAPSCIAIADVNGDGKFDLLVIGGNALGVLLGNGNGSFQSELTFAAGKLPGSMVVGDVNGDGRPDVAVLSRSVLPQGTMSVLLGNGNGTFQSAQTFANSSRASLTMGDINSDGKPDLVDCDVVTATVSVLLNATNGNFTGQLYTIADPAAATQLVIAGTPATITAGSTVVFTVIAEDQFGQTSNAYRGTVTFTSNDPFAALPANTTLTGGVGTFTAILKSPGNATLTATDVGLNTITGSSAAIAVVDVPTHFQVSAPIANTAGSGLLLAVAALDPLGKTFTSYSGTVHFSSTDDRAFLPADTTLTGGLGVFAIVLRSAGTQTITASETAGGGLTSTSAAITVTAAAPSHLGVTTPANAVTGNALAITVTALDPYGNAAPAYNGTVAIASSDPAALLPANVTLTAGQGLFSATLNSPGTNTVTATDPSSVLRGGSTTIITRGLLVTGLTPTATGFVATFNKALDPGQLNLYDQNGVWGADDVLLSGPGSPQISIRGSLLIDPGNQTITFVKTSLFNGPAFNPASAVLPAGTYTVTFRSAANGFKDGLGAPLDGLNNGNPAGSNYTATFLVAAAPAVVGIPNFARGPDSADPINLPNTASLGIPVNLSAAAGVSSGTFTLTYNSALLNVTGASPNSSLAGAALSLDAASSPGKAIIDFSSPSALTQAGVIRLGGLAATVPNSAAGLYKSKAMLHWSGVQLNGGTMAAIGADAVEVVAYFGDATGDGQLSGGDAAAISQAATGTFTSAALGTLGGFAAFPLADPVILGDLNNNGNADAPDVTLINSLLSGTTHAQIPQLPGGLTIVPTGPDPTLSLPAMLQASAGATVAVPINIDTARPAGSTGLTEAILALKFDPRTFTTSAADIGLGTVTGTWPSASGWQMRAEVNNQTGEIGIDLFGTAPIQSSAAGSLVTIVLHVRDSATAGVTGLHFVTEVNPSGQRIFETALSDSQGSLVLHQAVTDNGIEPGFPGEVLVSSVQPQVAGVELVGAGSLAPDMSKSAADPPLAQGGLESLAPALTLFFTRTSSLDAWSSPLMVSGPLPTAFTLPPSPRLLIQANAPWDDVLAELFDNTQEQASRDLLPEASHLFDGGSLGEDGTP
jgi:hypothetical protein